MKKICVLILAVVISSTAFSQNKMMVEDCHLDFLFVNCQIPPSFGKDSLQLQAYFEQALKTEIGKISGEIIVGLQIDTSGKICCSWIENKSKYDIIKNRFDHIIKSMPDWTPGLQKGTKVNCAELIYLMFSKNKLIVTNKMGR